MRRIRRISGAKALVVLYALLLACSASATTLTVAGWGNAQVWARVIEAFEQAHPDIDVQVQLRGFADHHEKLVVEMAAHVAPDVFLLSWAFLGEFAVAGALLPIQPYIERDAAELRMDEYFPPALYDATFEDVLYGLPWLVGGRPMYYNLDLLGAAGMEAPTNDWTWDEWLEMARRTTVDRNGDGVRDQFGFHGPYRWETWATLIFSNGGSFLNADQTAFALNTPEVRDAFEFLADVVHTYEITPRTGESAAFLQGTQTFGLEAPTTIGPLEEQQPFQWGMALPPKGSAGHAVPGGNLPLVIWSQSPNIQAAWEFVKFASSPEMELLRSAMGYSPPARSSTYLLVESANVREYGYFLNHQVKFTSMLYDQIIAVVRQHIGPVFERTQTVENAVISMEAELNPMLSEFWSNVRP